jgi:hypothetical protein
VLSVKKLLIVLAAAFVAAGAASAERAASKDCGVASGPRYVFLGASRAKYIVTTDGGVKCSFAILWMRRLAPQRVSAPFPLLEGGPAGWSCRAVKMQGTPTAALGSCIRGSRAFTWLPPPRRAT